MKKVAVLSLLLAFTANTYCQQTVPNQTIAQTNYLQKSKNQKKTAHILLAIGGGLMLTAFVIPRGEKIQDGICLLTWCTSDEYKNDQLKGVIGVTGAAAALGSISFFRASSRNRKKATTLSSFLQMERAPLVQTAGRTMQVFPALAFRWQF